MSKARQTRRKTEQIAEKGNTPKPRNAAQIQAKANLHSYPIQIFRGPPGTSKTHTAIALAWELFCAGKCDRIIVTRPVVACGGEDLGFLPGDLNEKMSPWLAPILDCLTVIIGSRDNAAAVMKRFEFLPIAHVRGRSFLAGTVALFDECQNASAAQIYAYMTRFCDGSHMFLCGDSGQSDLPGGGRHFDRIADECQREGVAAVVEFTEDMCVRSPKIAGINRAFARVRAGQGT